MNKELKEALDVLEKEKEISKETLFEAIENSLLTACKQHFGKADNVKVEYLRFSLLCGERGCSDTGRRGG